ncbi:Autophagy protein 7, partial [Podochytrium sp. JEL0797]
MSQAASPPSTPALVQFAALSSYVDATFWHALSQRKIDTFRLDAAPRALHGHYAQGAARLVLPGAALDEPGILAPGLVPCRGILINYNTVEDFKNADKPLALRAAADEMWRNFDSEIILTEHHQINPFLLLTFADLKKFKFYYWFAFPALLPTHHFTADSIASLASVWPQPKISALKVTYDQLRADSPTDSAFVLVKPDPVDPSKIVLGKLADWESFWTGIPASERTIAFVDPSNLSQNPGWPLRNALMLLKRRFNIDTLNVVCYREGAGAGPGESLYIQIGMRGELDATTCPKSVGWEKNSTGKLGARLVDLAPMMDPTRLAETAVDLNLKLMRWRIMPELQLEKIAEQKCLLLGSGTLGCYVARALMAWGVRNITLVDNGTVSFSNPIRQPLFTFEDSVEAKPKAQAAADALKRIFPSI